MVARSAQQASSIARFLSRLALLSVLHAPFAIS
jgi:hypothetical protein